MQIIVLGMHRSGTSMVARLLNMMGAYFAPDNIAMQPTVANPKGYWEREDIWHLNDAIFKKLGVSWDNISDFDVSKITEDIQAEFAPDIQKIIFSLDANRPWMIKDPRLCLLLDVWKPLLEVPVCVYVYRDPIQVAQSLTSRENSYATIKGSTLHNIHLADYSKNKANFPISLGMALWEKYTLNGLASSAGLPRVLISFHDLVANPIATANNLYKKLLAHEVQGLRLPSDKEILAYLDPKLCHADGDNKLQKNYVNSQQTKLIKSFQKGKIFKLNPLPDLSAGASEILEEYQNKLLSADKILVCRQDITQRNAEIIQRDSDIENHLSSIVNLENHSKDLDSALHNSEQARIRYQQQVGNYKSQLLAAEQKINALKQENTANITLKKQLEISKTELATKEQKISDYSQQIATLTSQLEHQEQNVHKLSHWILALNNDITAAFASLSWRSGRIFTRMALALMFKKAGTTAEDHIQEITEAIQNWKLSDTSERSISGHVVEKIPILTTLKKVAAQHVARDYQQWIKNYDTLTSKIVSQMQQQIEQWDSLPLISIVMPTYNTDEKWLRAAIDSVLQQVYSNWELCIADDASTKEHVRKILEEYAERDARIKVTFRTENGHISAASNTALELVNGEFVTFLDHDDMLTRHALFWMVKDILDYPDTMLWYSDEDKLDKKGVRSNPYFKSDWNPDLFLSHNLITHLAVYRKTLIDEIGGFREGYEGAQDYDLVLRVIEQISPAQIRHIPRVLYHWREIEGSTASRPDEKPYAIIAAQKAIAEHLERRNIKAWVTESPLVQGTIRVQYALPVRLPLVSLIIPTRNSLKFLHRCVESILNKTDYQNFEILIINNNSDDPATLDYMQQLEQNEQARIIDYPHPFCYADMNNLAVEQAQGEIIGLLNNDLEVINSEWLSEMVSHAIRPEVGAVGAKLWYPNNTLQHGGVVLGIGGVAGHAHKSFPQGHVGYFGRAALIQNFSAVTAACMVMRKANFLAVEGLDAEHLGTALNDVDLCLKLNEHNLKIVWTPYAELYHHESASRGYEDTPEKKARYEKERAYMKKRWPQFLMADPAYSPNLSLEAEDFAYAWPPRVSSL